MRIRTARDLGIAVRNARRHAGLTQEELANLARVSRPWISGLETGKARAELASILKVIDTLDLTLTLESDGPTTDTADLVDLDSWLDTYQAR